jgi:hypothetical protein
MKNIFKILVIFSLTSCVSGLNDNQVRKLSAIENQHPELMIKDKSEVIGGALGILPGGGSFYTRHYGTGVVNLLLWPISVLWDPINGVNGSKEINYYSTLSNVKRIKNKEIKKITDSYNLGKINDREFNLMKMDIESKYDFDADL